MAHSQGNVGRSAEEARDLRGARSLVVLVAIQALAVVALAVWLLVLQRPLGYREEWRIQVRPPSVGLAQPFGPLLVVIAFGGAAGYLAYLVRRHRTDRWRRWFVALFVVTLVVGVYALQVAALLVPQFALPFVVASTTSDIATEYFVVADHIVGVGEFLRTYDVAMAHSQHHLATHPPGAVLVYWALIKLWDSTPGLAVPFAVWLENAAGMDIEYMSEWSAQFPGVRSPPPGDVPKAAFCSLMLPWFGALSLVPIYLLAAALQRARAACSDEAPGDSAPLASLALMATVPSLVLFIPALDQAVLLCAAWALYAVVAGWLRGRWWATLLGGVALGLGCFVSFGLTAVGPVLAVFIALTARRGRDDRGCAVRHSLLHLAALLAGVLAVAVFAQLALGVNVPAVWRQGMAAHAALTHTRTYPVWLGLNLVEFAVFLGLPIAVALLAGLISTRRWREALREPHFALAAATVLIILVLDVSGRIRGEVGRIWLFLLPPLALYAGSWLGQRRLAAYHLGATIGLQIVQLWLMALALAPFVRPY